MRTSRAASCDFALTPLTVRSSGVYRSQIARKAERFQL